MPYLACPGCGVRQYTPPLHVRRRCCPVCDTEFLAGSLLHLAGSSITPSAGPPTSRVEQDAH